MKRLIVALAGALGAIAIWFGDEIIFGPPVSAFAAFIGPLPGFLISTLVYGFVSYHLSMLLVKALKRRGEKKSRIERAVIWLFEWLKASSHGRAGERTRRMGSAVGFFLSSWWAGGIVTTGSMQLLNYQGDIRRLAIRSNIIFAIMFCGQYSGIVWFIRKLV